VSLDLRDKLQSALGADYKVLRELSAGGMASVYLAEELSSQRVIAIKVLSPDLAAGVSIERFRREIRVASRLKHEAIVPVLDTVQSGDLIFYTMPYVDGESLRSRLARDRQLSIDVALRIAQEVALCLAHAHEHNIVHRDIKPANILLDRESRVVVIDFGIARAIGHAADLATVTSTGLTIGTPAYMSPEQASAEKVIDGRSDIYSLGCVLYEMLAGQPPFTGPTAQAIIARHLSEAPPPLRVVRPQLDESVERVIETALAKSPADRFPSATAFAEALADPAHARTRASRRARARALMRIGVGIVAAAAAWLTWSAVRSNGSSIARTALDPRRIAVLYFDDHSADHSLGYLPNGESDP